MRCNWRKKDKPNWHSYRIGELPTLDDLLNLYARIVKWIMESIENPLRHALWKIDATDLSIRVRFRYERDFINFVLKWGQ